MPSLLRDATSASFPTEIMSVQNHLKQEVPKPYKRFYIKAISKPLCRVSYLCWDEPIDLIPAGTFRETVLDTLVLVSRAHKGWRQDLRPA